MPSYPTSVFSAASKTSGQTIQPAHVNDLQDEVTAIEGALINGTAPVHASSLTVTGGALLNALPYTFPSSGGSTGHILTIVSTSGSTMGLEWRSVAATVPDAVRAVAGSTQTLHSSQAVVIRTLTSQGYITNSSMHSVSADSSRVTPQSTGLYLCIGQIDFSQNSTGLRGVAIIDSSGGQIAANEQSASTVSTEPQKIQCSGIKRFDVLGGYVRLQSNQVGASTLSARSAASGTWLEVVKL